VLSQSVKGKRKTSGKKRAIMIQLSKEEKRREEHMRDIGERNQKPYEGEHVNSFGGGEREVDLQFPFRGGGGGGEGGGGGGLLEKNRDECPISS